VIGPLVEYVTRGVVRHPESVAVTATQVSAGDARRGRMRVEITVAPDDYGRVIGKSGQTIDAIRTIAAVAGDRQGVDVSVDVLDIEE
jgi:uncharacterized protein